MELFSAQFFSALIAVVIIDLILAGDNAIVIAIAARNVAKHLQKRAIIWGTAGAIVVRAAMTLFVVWLLRIPGLLLVGGLLLIWIGYRLLVPAREGKHSKSAVDTFWGAMRTIIVADAVMGFDNVLGVAGAAHDSFLLVIIGLLISVPIVVWGSTLLLSWIDRFPGLIYIGAGVLAWTAAKMITDEPILKEFLLHRPVAVWAIYALVTGGVLLCGYAANKRKTNRDGPR
ncbi:MAG TPA: TerC family protein [Burkholderiales bacterium]|nr:TerC family protein [Burkholderiales bacterium]